VGIYRDYLTVGYANDQTFDRSPLLIFEPTEDLTDSQLQ
jgi:hypothetical protein